MAAENRVFIFQRLLCFVTLITYSGFLCLETLVLLSYSPNPLIGEPWCSFSGGVFLRWIPIAIYLWLRRCPVYISRLRRFCALVLAVASISLSSFLLCLSADQASRFAEGFFETALDIWPATVLLLTVTSRIISIQNFHSNVTTPIA
jgi:hypothetical protein